MNRHLLAACLSLVGLVGPVARAETVDVATLSGPFRYAPNAVAIVAGDRVHWQASSQHPFRMDFNPDVQSTTAVTLGFGAAAAGATFNFYCDNHGAPGGVGMSGTVTVQANPDLIHFDEFEAALVPNP